MSTESNRRSGSYEITNVRKGHGKNDYVVTVVRDGRPMGDVNVRASRNAPAYFGDSAAKKAPEAAE